MQVSLIHNMLEGVDFTAKYGLFIAELALFFKAIKLVKPLNGVTALEQCRLISPKDWLSNLFFFILCSNFRCFKTVHSKRDL